MQQCWTKICSVGKHRTTADRLYYAPYVYGDDQSCICAGDVVVKCATKNNKTHRVYVIKRRHSKLLRGKLVELRVWTVLIPYHQYTVKHIC